MNRLFVIVGLVAFGLTARAQGASESPRKPITTFLEPAFQKWEKEVAQLPVTKQLDAVAKKLKELNPEFDGEVRHQSESGIVTEIYFATDNLVDISPVRVFLGLKMLVCEVKTQKGSQLADLSPLKGMDLECLICDRTLVADLSPLKDMPLTSLVCDSTPISDLSPLRGMELTWLICDRTKVSDLSPLRGMPLLFLSINETKVSDLSPLTGMPLDTVLIKATSVSDLTPLKGMRLDLLNCSKTPVSDLSPLTGMPLTSLYCDNTKVSDLSPLAGMRLNGLWCDNTRISDLSALQGMPLELLQCQGNNVTDLSPLEKCERLSSLYVSKTKVTAAGIAALQKALPSCKIEWDDPAKPKAN